MGRRYQNVWEQKAGDPRLPRWLRLASLTHGKHRANGHASFKIGDVALVPSTIDDRTGEICTRSRQRVFEAIQSAIEYSLLAKGSTSRYLIVPPHAIEGGLG